MSVLSLACLLALPLAAQPRLPSPALKEVQTLFDAARYEDVARRLENGGLQGLKRRERAGAYALLGKSYERRGKIQQALGVYQFAEGLYPKDINLLSDLANLLHRIELSDRAKPLYERVLAIHPNNAAAHRALGEIYRSQGFLERAERHFETALQELSGDARLWSDYAHVLAERQNLPGAIAAAKRVLEFSPSPDAWLDLALYERRQGDPEAYAHLRESRSLDPARADLLLQEGLWRLEDGDLDAAQSAAQEALRRDPQEPLGLWLRARVSLGRGRPEEARADLAAALAQRRRAPFTARVCEATLEALPPP